ncbi:hypothetical protein ACFV0O_34360 [Kitasatospora sp. NPDC059577]|uniref:hypothetical protein n=1 Tax=unclassified Kitasatospora TaxID=2633591 RepID=UPI0036C12F27
MLAQDLLALRGGFVERGLAGRGVLPHLAAQLPVSVMVGERTATIVSRDLGPPLDRV